ncbi:MAG: SDR family oxidoreductase [Novosphingobium sp.]|jgi:NAD(P)-dependent dehydrogenase (short-subunit alcohol dehydrogenase family)|nr:SDR family oxidoreductase [Novosphingobium sp.]
MTRLAGKRILFIGGITNIGAAAVQAIVREGARVAVADIDEVAGPASVAAYGDAARFFPVDVTREDSVAALVAAAVDWLGGLDGLCQNAGFLRAGPVDSFPADLWDQVYAVNVRAQFFGVKHAVPHLKRAGKGSIVNMSSLAGKHGGPGRAAYSSAKAAVIGMGNSLASELAPFGIRVNTLCPGWIDTPFNRPAIDFIGGDGAVDDMVRATVPMGRQGTPDEVAPIYVYLLSEESSYVTSQALIIDGGSYS